VIALQTFAGGHVTPGDWLWVIVPALVLVGVVGWLVVHGRSDARGITSPVARAADSLRRLSPLPAWCSGGLAMLGWALLVAVLGFVWDVSWHIDFGRDRQLFTPPHVLILTGLLGIGVAGLVAIALASVDRTRTTWRIGPFSMPASAVALGALSIGAGIGFPLDDLWHRAYGIDVTMWSPTHLLMIGGASLSPLAGWLMFAEGGGNAFTGRAQRVLRVVLASAALLGLSTLQLEFDLGVPQWQALYQPVLIAAATGVGLVAARVALGRGGAVKAAAGFLVARSVIALVVGKAMGHDLPHFPLYLGGAVAVEAVFALTPRLAATARAMLAGAAAGTIGLATEWGFTHAFGREPWQASLLPGVWIAVAVAVAGSLLGLAIGRVVSGRPSGVRGATLALAGVAFAALLVIPLPRHGTAASVTMRTTPASAPIAVIDRDGVASEFRRVDVTVTVSPPSAVRDADWFVVQSWQGGSLQTTPLIARGEGVYVATRPVPTGGSWKTIVFLQKGSAVAAAPVWMPADRQYGLPAIPVEAERTSALAPAKLLLTREVHGGPAWPSVVAYGGLGITLIAWLATLVVAFAAVARRPRREIPLPAPVARTLKETA